MLASSFQVRSAAANVVTGPPGSCVLVIPRPPDAPGGLGERGRAGSAPARRSLSAAGAPELAPLCRTPQCLQSVSCLLHFDFCGTTTVAGFLFTRALLLLSVLGPAAIVSRKGASLRPSLHSLEADF